MKRYRGFKGEIPLEGLGTNGWYVYKPSPSYPAVSPAPIITAIAPLATSIPYIDPARRYTTEQIQEMMARKAEITASQNSQGGDGIDEDLEQIANEQNATDAAVAAGDGLPVKTGAGKPSDASQLAPFAILGALAYFLL
jgi:hypothetical protein